MGEMDRAPLPHRRVVRRVLRKARPWERQKVLALLSEEYGGLPVDDPIANAADEIHVRLDRREVAAPTDHELLVERRLEDVMGLLRDSVLVRLSWLDPSRLRAVVLEHGRKAAIELATSARNLVRRGGEVIAAPDPRYAAELPKRTLQAAHECLERLGKREPDPSPLAEAQDELKEHVREHFAGDRDAELRGVGEVEGPLASRLVLLLEHHLLRRSVEGAPLMDAPLHRAKLRGAIRVPVTPP
jgi:hypothetical protein